MRAITFLKTLCPQELQRYHQVVSHSELIRSHLDVLRWLQGDMQQFLPHEIMIAAWGDFNTGAVQHDVISPMSGLSSLSSNPVTLTPLLANLFYRWVRHGKVALAINTGNAGFLLDDAGLQCPLSRALATMHTAIVHCICDERGSLDCLYVAFSTQRCGDDSQCGAMTVLLPFIDLALRQIEYLPHQTANARSDVGGALSHQEFDEHTMSDREMQILRWVANGKTNPEIGSILNISVFTVKNHMQRMFKKLNATNRAQAVAKFHAISSNA
jgi:transcriptional regulator EpsA